MDNTDREVKNFEMKVGEQFDTVKQAQAEMEKVTASKKSLLERWQKSIMLMQKKDSTVQTLRERVHDEN